MNTTLAHVPPGAAPAAGYYPGVAVATQGVLCAPGQAPVPGPEHVPGFDFDPKHCHYVRKGDDGILSQCGSWPVRKDGVDNPDLYCAGHMKKANNGADAEPDQDVRTDAS